MTQLHSSLLQMLDVKVCYWTGYTTHDLVNMLHKELAWIATPMINPRLVRRLANVMNDHTDKDAVEIVQAHLDLVGLGQRPESRSRKAKCYGTQRH